MSSTNKFEEKKTKNKPLLSADDEDPVDELDRKVLVAEVPPMELRASDFEPTILKIDQNPETVIGEKGGCHFHSKVLYSLFFQSLYFLYSV